MRTEIRDPVFVTQAGTSQTHNVVANLPSQQNIHPLWYVIAYDNADFNTVSNLTTAAQATLLDQGIATVNCPIVKIN